MFPQSGSVEAPKDHVMIQVVPGVQDGNVPKEMMVRLQDIFRPVPRLSQNLDHDPHPFFSVPGT